MCLLVLHRADSYGILEDVAMSVAGLDSLIHAQSLFIEELYDYTVALQSTIYTMERCLFEVSSKIQQWRADPEAYLANPLNSFALIRRLHEDWSYIETYMQHPVSSEYADNVYGLFEDYAPTATDLEDAMKAIIRIQDCYDLEAAQLANGLIDGKQYDAQLNALDCFAMAEFCKEKPLLSNAVAWYKEALERYNYSQDNDLYDSVYKLTVNDFYGKYANKLAEYNNNKEALNVLNKAADLHNVLWLQRRILEDSVRHLSTGYTFEKDPLNSMQIGCRGQFPNLMQMYCYYQNSKEPFLILAPLKVELLNNEPYVALYHDVIYENEIKELLSVNLASMRHDRTTDHKNSVKYTTVTRHLDDVLNHRVMDMTAMNVASEKDFLLINYGIGGHIRALSEQQRQLNNVMASIIFFLSEVPQGGDTILPELEIAIKPKKGAALVTHHLDKQLKIDLSSDHLSCPVLVGSMWKHAKTLSVCHPIGFEVHIMKFLLAVICFSILVYGTLANGPKNYTTELYSSSIVGLLKLLDIEDKFVANLQEYAEALEERLETLQIFLRTLNRDALKNPKEQEQYVSNPLNAFGLIRRIRQDWRALQVLMGAKAGAAQLAAMTELLAKAPTEHDMEESLVGINRIELTYDLSAIDIAEGRLQGKQFNNTLSIRDCLAIANHNYDNKDYGRALMWYHIALRRENEPNFLTYNKILGRPLNGIRRRFARARLLQGMPFVEPTLNKTETLEKVDAILKATNASQLDNFVNELLEHDDMDILGVNLLKSKPTAHYLGCRGLFPKPKNLSCRYNSTTTPFLRLAPLKLEEISHDPYIVMYHSMLSDSEIEKLKRLSVHMENGLSSTDKPNNTEPIDIVARAGWLVEATPFLERINRRITDMTGFDVQDMWTVLLANYGIGSYFKPHYDYMYGGRVSGEAVAVLGERIASLIIYASDVAQGGATNFPDIQVAVQPQKGNSLFWYNMFDDGTPDPRSLHSVCPTIVGSRWMVAHVAPDVYQALLRKAIEIRLEDN
ncbi:prolyl 4-hydroxylase subunit alpha-1-like [Drosophila novamexicana]|uniref:prolyl 4-hydroxylase subunit alpha-1-like n=1 Tax=Drosophila novamexicana TaxID=47314 RepID=UPI0011E5C6F6|nr:prolyl 4-hydroxylase subunit alpha-1-like [Drosophila novamexicana]